MNHQPETRGTVSLRLLSWLGLFLLFFLGLGYFFYNLQPASAGIDAEGQISYTTSSAIEFSITKGETFRGIGAHLSQSKLIRSVSVFKLYSFLMGTAQRFQPGIYTLSDTMSLPEIVQILTAGEDNDITVTIPEGLTVKDVDEILKTANVLASGESLAALSPAKVLADYPEFSKINSLEGLMFPDTYRFKLHTPAEDIAHTLLETFRVKAWPTIEGDQNWYQKLILASYLEREVSDFEDRRIIAGIIFRRIKIGMPIQIDATVTYAKCGGRFQGCSTMTVTKNDLSVSSPYNTYQRLGWTPTPIASPGQAALRAAVTPVTSQYLYYLSRRDTGETLFSRTLEEHNVKRAKYL